ncbi:hypothetical protein Q4I30_001893 [Leishmania utingensis]|uniref:Uncharacterized protein n=1 Tax=Leishmania utingensis TaxID=653362 RepID=A0AAW3AT40_9TRYP
MSRNLWWNSVPWQWAFQPLSRLSTIAGLGRSVSTASAQVNTAQASPKWNTRLFFCQGSLTQLVGELLEEAAPNMTGDAAAAEDDLKHHNTAELFRPTTQQTTRKGKQDDAPAHRGNSNRVYQHLVNGLPRSLAKDCGTTRGATRRPADDSALPLLGSEKSPLCGPALERLFPLVATRSGG